ncbi:hypothetical protein ABTF76_22805, partial [Acinetobacter baumannii]
FNLLWAATHEWIGIARDIWSAPGWRNKLGYALMPPGWSHDGSRDTSEAIKQNWAATRAEREQNAWKRRTSSSSAG